MAQGNMFCDRCPALERQIAALKEALENSQVASRRSHDHSTSIDAADQFNKDAGKKVKAQRAMILRLFQQFGPMADDELWRRHSDEIGRQATKASSAKRRLELQRMGLARYAGRKVRISTGRTAKVWELTDLGREWRN